MSLFLPGTASLVESLDRKVTVVLRDGRNLVGMFRSFDQHVDYICRRISREPRGGLPAVSCAPRWPGCTAWPGCSFRCFFAAFLRFSNVVLEGAVERHVVGTQYGDVPLGLYILRGENIVLLGEIDDAKEQGMGLEKVDVETILKARVAQKKADAAAGCKPEDLWKFDQW